eukprot:gene18259-20792_t
MIFVYVIAGVTGLWCLYQAFKLLLQVEQSLKRKLKLREELNLVRLRMPDQPAHSPHIQVSGRIPRQAGQVLRDRSNKTSEPTRQAQTPKPIGAYANGAFFDQDENISIGHLYEANALGISDELDGNVSDSSSSVVLSSLHSSERSDVSNRERIIVPKSEPTSVNSEENFEDEDRRSGNSDASSDCYTCCVALVDAVLIADYDLSTLSNSQGFTMSSGGKAVSNAGD